MQATKSPAEKASRLHLLNLITECVGDRVTVQFDGKRVNILLHDVTVSCRYHHKNYKIVVTKNEELYELPFETKDQWLFLEQVSKLYCKYTNFTFTCKPREPDQSYKEALPVNNNNEWE